MKFNSVLFLFLAIELFSCDADDEEIDVNPVSEANIGGETFIPSDNKVNVSTDNILFSFEDENSVIKIITNDVMPGTYEVTSEVLKSGALMANVNYSTGGKTYKGVSGVVTVGITDNIYFGTYEALLESGENSIEITGGTFEGLEGTSQNLILSESGINQALQESYAELEDFIRFVYILDAVYSNQVGAPDGSWQALYNHTQDASDQKVEQLWNDGFDILYDMAILLESTETVIPDEDARNKLLGQIHTIRAHVGLHLINWFGGLPVIDRPDDEISIRYEAFEVLEWVIMNAELATAEYLPDDWSGEEDLLFTKSFTRALLSRAYLIKGDYTYSYALCEIIKESGMYSLDESYDNFQQDNSEIYWGFDAGNNQEFNGFFGKGEFVPAIRYTETHLILAITSFHLNYQEDLTMNLNLLRERRGEPILEDADMDNVYQQIKTELYHEGEIFTYMKSFDKAGEELLLNQERYLLPVPLSVLEANPGFDQNPGY